MAGAEAFVGLGGSPETAGDLAGLEDICNGDQKERMSWDSLPSEKFPRSRPSYSFKSLLDFGVSTGRSFFGITASTVSPSLIS